MGYLVDLTELNAVAIRNTFTGRSRNKSCSAPYCLTPQGSKQLNRQSKYSLSHLLSKQTDTSQWVLAPHLLNVDSAQRRQSLLLD